jgi:hypothetical protein
MKMIQRIFFFICILISCSSKDTSSEISEADHDRINKATACINLCKATLHHDKDFFAKYLKREKTVDQKELHEAFFYKLLINCYSTISLKKSAEFIARKYQNINPFSAENKELTSFKKYIEVYKENQERFQTDKTKLKSILDNHLSEEVKILNKIFLLLGPIPYGND